MNVKVSAGPGSLFLVFLILKLTETIDWSWVWVTAPLWIPFSLVFLVFVILGAIFLVSSAITFLPFRKKRKPWYTRKP